MKSIAVFNNKGGVGKTTFLCNLASFLCLKKRKKILVIDADPQCNTSTYVLNDNQFYDVYYDPKCFTIADIIPPIEDGSGFINKYEPVKSLKFGFDIIPGNPQFAASEDFLASEWKDVKSGEFRGIKSSMLFFHFLTLCSKYDLVFFDMGPSLGAINRTILLASDYFVTPMSSDIFSLLALDNIGSSISQWNNLFDKGVDLVDKRKMESLGNLKKKSSLKFLGYVEQQYISKSVGGTKSVVHAYDKILKRIPQEINKQIVKKINKDVLKKLEYKIGSIPNFYSLVPMSQSAHKPIFALSGEDGVVGAHYQKVKDFENLFSTIAERLIKNMEAING